MADTQRSLTTILTTLIQDGQADGAITEQDIRDIVVSLTPPMGRCDMQANATATTVTVAGTYYKMAGTTALGGSEHLFDDDTGTSNRLRYIGASPRHMHIANSISFITASSNQVVSFKTWFYDDSAASGSYLDSSLVTRKVGTGADIGAVALHADVLMDTNDYIELHLTNETTASTVTVEDFYFFAMGMFM